MNREPAREGNESTEAKDLDIERELSALADRARDEIEQFVQERPHAALGLAAALGFIVGGGLTPRRLVRLGFAAAGPMLSRQLMSQLTNVASGPLSALTGPERESFSSGPAARERARHKA